MARFGKPDATGRSSGKLSGRARRLWSPPKGEPWTWHTVEMMESDAWRALSIRGRRLLDFLELDHAAHAGRSNGELMATYDQLAKSGIVRRFILETIEEVKRLGFIKVDHGGRWNMTNRPSLYCLTYYADKDGNPATNEWRRFSKTEIDAQNQNRPTESDTTVVPLGDTTKRLSVKPSSTKTAGIRHFCK